MREQYDWVPDWFQSKAKPDPAEFEDIIASAQQVEFKLSSDTAIGGMNGVESEIEEWRGTFINNLQNGVTEPFDIIVQNQLTVAKSLVGNAEGIVNLYHGLRRDYSTLADKTIEALKDCGEKDGGGAKMGLSILSALASVVTAGLTGPTSTSAMSIGGLVVATIGAGANLGSNAIDDADPTENLDLGAPTVSEVMGNMIDRSSDITTALHEQEEKITGVLNDNLELMIAVRQLGNAKGLVTPLMPMRPTIADADNPTSGIEPDRE